ncbi:hypothetical protein LWI28_028128 [Acer negundo]|uniref:Uncharacterized protein n=1 Tax=Acer negundo TaxID=4023 RepID=A0AAD5IGQ6_ACENE|nr:hypothetical protein LWI28_028128 [Acer negundo]
MGKLKISFKGYKRFKQVQENLLQSVEKYKLAADKKRRHLEFDVGDFVWAVLTKDRASATSNLVVEADKMPLSQ